MSNHNKSTPKRQYNTSKKPPLIVAAPKLPPPVAGPDSIRVDKDGKILTLAENHFMKAWIPSQEKVFEEKLTLSYTFPRISLEVWRQCVGFNKWVVDEHGCEAMLSLFIDKTTNQVIPAVFHQQLEDGLAVGLDYTSAENDVLMEDYRKTILSPGIYWGTIHNHVTAGAFQSGTDEKDEEGLVGPHITLGKMDKDTLDLHARICARFQNGEEAYQKFYPLPTQQLIDIEPEMKRIVDHVGIELAESTVREISKGLVFDCKQFDFPEEWKERVKPVRTAALSGSSYPHGMHCGGAYGYAQDEYNGAGMYGNAETFEEAMLGFDIDLHGTLNHYMDDKFINVTNHLSPTDEEISIVVTGDSLGLELPILRAAMNTVVLETDLHKTFDYWSNHKADWTRLSTGQAEWSLDGHQTIKKSPAEHDLCRATAMLSQLVCDHPHNKMSAFPRVFIASLFGSQEIADALKTTDSLFSDMGTLQFFFRDFECVCNAAEKTWQEGIAFFRDNLDIATLKTSGYVIR